MTVPRLSFLVILFARAFAPAALCAAPSYDPKPWLDDLAQMHQAFSDKYANFEWAVFVHEADLSGLFADARKRIEAGGNDGDARAALDRLIRKLGDGHVELHWPDHGVVSQTNALPSVLCGNYDAARNARALAALAAGYVALDTSQSTVFPAGVIVSGQHRVGVIKIGAFGASATPALCQQALAALAITADKPCDSACSDKIDAWAEARFNAEFIAQIEALKLARIDTLLIDVAGNGGGNEWSDAAARMLTPIRLKSGRTDFVRGEHWVKKFGDLESNLRSAANTASPEGRPMLLKYADMAEAKKQVAATPCDSAPFWEGKHPACSWLGEGFPSTGILASADPETLRGKPWAPLVFIPMEYPYTEGLWRGPLIVLVDSGSASSSERFASELQDNHAALILGEPTAGAVGGHTDGGTPTTLSHSGAVLVVPDCGGADDKGSVVPDVLVGFRKSDGPHLRAAAFLAELPEALVKVNQPLKSKL